VLCIHLGRLPLCLVRTVEPIAVGRKPRTVSRPDSIGTACGTC
jgi:hypothetical protein